MKEIFSMNFPISEDSKIIVLPNFEGLGTIKRGKYKYMLFFSSIFNI